MAVAYTPKVPKKETIGTIANKTSDNSAPSQATDGFDTLGHRFLDVWAKSTTGTSYDCKVYLYDADMGWTLFSTTSVTTAGPHKLIQAEVRTASRVYIRVDNFVGVNERADVWVRGITYSA